MMCRKVMSKTLSKSEQALWIELERRVQDAIRFFIWNSPGRKDSAESFDTLALQVLAVCARELSRDEDRMMQAFEFALQSLSDRSRPYDSLH